MWTKSENSEPVKPSEVSADGNAYEVSAVAGGAGNGEVKFSGANAGKTVVVPDTVTINGKLALDYSLAKLTDGKTAPDGSPIPGHLPRPWSTIRTSGPIGFQGMHGGALPYFRNVRIRQVR